LPTTSRTKAVEIAADTVQSVPMELAIYVDLRQDLYDLYAFVCKAMGVTLVLLGWLRP
jgi:hypothetical protein